MDTEVYSNTGGKASKATPITIETQGVEIAEGRAIAKFAASGIDAVRLVMPFLMISS